MRPALLSLIPAALFPSLYALDLPDGATPLPPATSPAGFVKDFNPATNRTFSAADVVKTSTDITSRTFATLPDETATKNIEPAAVQPVSITVTNKGVTVTEISEQTLVFSVDATAVPLPDTKAHAVADPKGKLLENAAGFLLDQGAPHALAAGEILEVKGELPHPLADSNAPHPMVPVSK